MPATLGQCNDEWMFAEHLRSHHFLREFEAAPSCVLTHGCTYERRPRPEDDFWAHDRTQD